jgi:hypothetical protein
MGWKLQAGLDGVERRALLVPGVSAAADQGREGLVDAEDPVDRE